MDELQSIYRVALHAQIAALEAACAAGGSDVSRSVRRIAHTLRGSGGTYGFPHISAAAAAVEDAAAPDLDARLSTLLDVLRSEAALAESSDESARTAPAAPAGNAAPTHASPRQSRRVLIVDDDAETRLLVSHVLAAAGHTIAEAGSGAEALAAYERGAPDVVLMDVMLGAEDGVAAAAALVSASAPRTPVIIFLTGVNDEGARARMFAAGAAGVITKPFDPAALAAELSRIAAL